MAKPDASSNLVSPRNPGGGDAAPPINPGFEDRFHSFWEKNNRGIYIICCLILVGILAKGGWEYFAAQHESQVEADYAAAATPGQLKAFAAAHPDHSLAGLAHLQTADAAYAANNVAEALAGYQQAADILKTGPFAARARLGLAMCQIQSGQAAEGESALRQLADDPQGFRAVRTEATYQLASFAAASGRGAEVQRLAAQLLQIDPNSSWTQRAFALEAEQAVARGPAAPARAPAISFKP